MIMARGRWDIDYSKSGDNNKLALNQDLQFLFNY